MGVVRVAGASSSLSSSVTDGTIGSDGAEVPLRTEVLVHAYANRPVVFVSQTGAVGSWMNVEASTTDMPDAGDGDNLDVNVSFMLGRRSEEENAALELLASQLMRSYARSRGSGREGEQAGGGTGPHDAFMLVIAVGLQSYDVRNIRAIVKLFEATL